MSLEATPTLSAAISQVFEVLLAEQLHTCLPAKITEYDGLERKATVQPEIKLQYLDDTDLEYQPIPDVPVISLNVGNAGLRLPADQYINQTCLLIFSERSLDTWLLKDDIDKPNDPRKFDVSDAIAIVGLNRFTNTDSGGNDLQLHYNNTDITIKEDGDIELNGGNKVTIKANGDIELGESTLKKLINDEFKAIFDNHTHNYIDGTGLGIGNTSTPSSSSPNLVSVPVANLPAIPPSGQLGVEIPTTAITDKVSAQ